MTRQKKQFLVMWILLFLCLAAFFGIRFYTKQAAGKEAKEQGSQEIEAASVDTDALDAFSYESGGTKYAFTAGADGWTCDSDPDRRLDADKITRMLESVKRVTATERIDEYEDLADFGLDEPQLVLSFTCGGRVTSMEIGLYNEMLGGYYLRVDGRDPVYLTDSAIKNAFSKTLDDLTAEEENSETETGNEDETETESGPETES